MGRPPKNIPKQQVLVKYAFQRELLGNLSFDTEKDHYRSSRYLLRNIKRVLRHHERRLIRLNASMLKAIGLGKPKGSSFSLSTRPSLSFGGGSSHASFSDARNQAAEPDDDSQFPAFLEYIKQDGVTLYAPPFMPEQDLWTSSPEFDLDIISLRTRSDSNEEFPLRSHGRQSSGCIISISWFSWSARGFEPVITQTRKCTLITAQYSKDIKIKLEEPFRFRREISQLSRQSMEMTLYPAKDDTSAWPPIPVTSMNTSKLLLADPELRLVRDGLHATCTDFPLRIPASKQVRVIYAASGAVFRTQYNLELAFTYLMPFQFRTTSQQSRMPGSAVRTAPRHIGTVPKVVGVVTTYTIASAQDQNFPAEVRRVNFTGFNCPLCLRTRAQTEFENILALRFHLITAHPAHKVVLQEVKPSTRGRHTTKYSFKISAANQKEAKFASRWLTWIAPSYPFDIAVYVDGDESWVSSRSITSSKGSALVVVESRSEALRRENNGFLPVQYIQDIPTHQRSKYPVPITRTRTPVPLFTSVTRRVLQPDEELSESDDEIDETWVRDKHAEEVMNATREPLEFRELQIRWNDHVRSEQISSAFYCNDVFFRWVKKNKEWLRSSEKRLYFYHRFSRQLWEAGKISKGVATACRAMIYTKVTNQKTDAAIAVTEINGA
jgi:hypothetical protein